MQMHVIRYEISDPADNSSNYSGSILSAQTKKC